MPVIQQNDPLSAASEAVGAFFQQKRQRQLEDQAQQYRTGRDARADAEADRRYGLEQERAIDQHKESEANLKTSALNNKIAEANAKFEEQMRPLKLEHERIQNKIDTQQLLTAKDVHTLRTYEIAEARVRAHVAQLFGVPEAQLRLSQGRASIDSTRAGIDATRAGTAATQQNTSENAALFPGRVQEQQQNIVGGGLLNEQRRVQLQTDRAALAAGPKASPELERDYRAQLSSYNRSYADFKKREAKGQLHRDETGKTTEVEPARPTSPSDFTAILATAAEKIRANPDDLPQALGALEGDPSLSVYQKRQAHLVLMAAARGANRTNTMIEGNFRAHPPGSGGMLNLGGSNGAPPFPGS